MNQHDVDGLVTALRNHFNAEVDYEPVNGSGRYRFKVTSPMFETMTQMERQDLVWEEVDKVLQPSATLDISLILTYSPADLAASA